MILEIRLSNFFSIKDEVVLDMQAASIQTKKAKELEENTFVCGDERLLKTVAIYGANASGKSSLIKAILIITMRIRYLPLLRSNSEALASQVHSSFASSLKVSNMNILLNSIKLRY